mgnify:CR=1 FL=1
MPSPPPLSQREREKKGLGSEEEGKSGDAIFPVIFEASGKAITRLTCSEVTITLPPLSFLRTMTDTTIRDGSVGET